MDTTAKLAMPLPMDELAAFCKKWRIVKLSVFGSILRDDFRPDSDVDFLAEFEEGAAYTLFDILHMQDELEAMAHRKVDLLNVDGVLRSDNSIRREEILDSAFPLFEQT